MKFSLFLCPRANVHYTRIDLRGLYTKADFQEMQFDSRADFKEARFYWEGDFEYAEFHGETSFFEAQFDSLVNFSFSNFRSETNFRFAQFNFNAYFPAAEFDSLVNFHQAHFDSVANFKYAIFGEGANFWSAHFGFDADFSIAIFDSLANFSLAQFHGDVNYRGTEFHKKADFKRAKFNASCDFSNTKFFHLLDLSNAKTEEDIKFDFAILPDTILLNATTLNGKLDFSNSIPKYSLHQCKINFYNTNINNLILDYTLFKIYYPDSIEAAFNKYRKIEAREIEKMYTDLLGIQEQHNFKEGYKKLDIEYQKFRLSSFSYWVRRLWDNFGYDKDLIFRNTVVLLGLSFLGIGLFFRYLITKVYCPESLNNYKENLLGNPDEKGHRTKKLLYAFYYTCILFFGIKMELKNLVIKGEPHALSTKKLFGIVLIFFTYFTGIVCAAYLANFIITK